MDAQVTSAIIGAAGGFLATVPIAYLTYRLAARKQTSETRFETQFYALLTMMLASEVWEARKFSTIKSHFKGIPSNDLRKALIAAGAVCIKKDGEEYWTTRPDLMSESMDSRPCAS